MSDARPAATLSVRLERKRVVGVGGGQVAAAKLVPLARDHGADVHVVAPTIAPELAAIATWINRPYGGSADITGAALVVAGTASDAVNRQVVADAERLGIWCVRVDRGGDGSAAFPATVRRGPLTIAVSTDGNAPVLARRLREELEELYGPEYGQLAQLLGDLRHDPAVTARLDAMTEQQRRRAWRSIPLADILAALRSGSIETAKEVAAACLSSSSD